MGKSSQIPCKEVVFKLGMNMYLWHFQPTGGKQFPEVRNQLTNGANVGNQEKWINLGRGSNIFPQHSSHPAKALRLIFWHPH